MVKQYSVFVRGEDIDILESFTYLGIIAYSITIVDHVK